jgi:NAD+ synthetase
LWHPVNWYPIRGQFHGFEIGSHEWVLQEAPMKIALLQTSPVHAQPEANANAIEAAYSEAIRLGAGLAVTPELAVPGNLPGERLSEPSMMRRIEAESHRLRMIAGSVPLLFGTSATGNNGDSFNELWWCERGELRAIASNGPFAGFGDCEGHFESGALQQEPIEHLGMKVGLAVGENFGASFESLARAGATFIVNAVSSAGALGTYVPQGRTPSWALPSKSALRRGFLTKQSLACNLPIAYVNRAGANGRLLYDGGSCLALPGGAWQSGDLFATQVILTDTNAEGDRWPNEHEPEAPWLRKALTAGMSGSLSNMGIEAVIVGLSGGIDSAVVAALAAGAICPQRVLGVAIPTRFTSEESIELAEAQAKKLGIHYLALDAEAPFAAATSSLAKAMPGRAFSLTDENIQSRCRGMLLMALTTEAPIHGLLGTNRCAVLSTANKSEAATGYFTMYGDAIGAFGALGDLLKARVYSLAYELGDAIPARVIARQPTAELRPGQLDESSLIPYVQLDAILGALLEAGLPPGQMHDALADVLEGQDLDGARAALPRILKLMRGSEFKRRQMPYALKVAHGA